MRRVLTSGFLGALVFVLALTACGAPPADVKDEDVSVPVAVQPEMIEIDTEDGRTLEGLYYPAAMENAPIVVLMHWAPGDMTDWAAVAFWLQSGLEASTGITGGSSAPYLDISWFPPMPGDISFNVVVFNFGQYGSSEYGGSRESYVIDGTAAMTFAANLPGVNPNKIAAIGASIGADGSVDACYQFNESGGMGTCVGALSLSSGNYLTDAFTYPEAAARLDAAGYPVWCLAAERDGPSPGLCQMLDGDHTQSFIFEGGDHGMDLLTPDQVFLEPSLTGFNPMQVLQEFLEVSLGIRLNDITIP